MKKNLLFLILCAVLCACSGTDISDVKGEYMLTSSRSLCYKGKEIRKVVEFKDSVATYEEGKFVYGYHRDSIWQRTMTIEESGRNGFVRNILLGEPDTLSTINGRFAPKRIASATEAIGPVPEDPTHHIVIIGGLVEIIYNGIRYFISKPIRIERNNTDHLTLAAAKPFFAEIMSSDAMSIGKAKIQYTYGPIYKHGDKIEWDAEYTISYPESLLQDPGFDIPIDEVKFHVEGTRVK